MMFPFYPYTSVGQEAFVPAQLAFLQRQVDAAEGGVRFPAFPYTSVGQTTSEARNLFLALQRRIKDLDQQWTNLQIERDRRQKRLNELLEVFPKSSSPAVKKASKEFFDEIDRLEPSLVQINRQIATLEESLRQSRIEEIRLTTLGGAATSTVSCVELADRIQRATQMGQPPAIIAALRNLYASKQCVAVTTAPAEPSQPPSPAVLAEVLANLRAQLAAQEAAAVQFRGTINQPTFDAQVQQTRAQIAAFESMERTSSPASEFPIGGAPASDAAAARPNYLVPAIVVGAALLVGGYLLTRPRP